MFKKLKNYMKSKRVVIIVLVSLITLICLSTSIFLFNIDTPFENIDHSEFSIDKNDKIIIFAPHPDDETLAAGGLIQKAVEKMPVF